jgi:hypothetical protein
VDKIECELLSQWTAHFYVYSELLGFENLSIVRYYKKLENTTFGNLICFRPQMRGGGEKPALLDLLERANLNHWSRCKHDNDKVLPA